MNRLTVTWHDSDLRLMESIPDILLLSENSPSFNRIIPVVWVYFIKTDNRSVRVLVLLSAQGQRWVTPLGAKGQPIRNLGTRYTLSYYKIIRMSWISKYG